MNFEKSIVELIKIRSSRRSYTSRPVEDEKQDALTRFFSGIKGPFDVRTRFRLVDTSTWSSQSINALGTYGTIRGANLFIVGAVERAERDMEHFGYMFEQIILFATDLALGTCWVGGIFNRSGFAEKIGIREHEIVPAVSPVGHATGRRSLTDSVIRWSAGSKSRKPWGRLFFHETFNTQLADRAAGRYVTPLEMVRLGPSASNRQPWRILKEPGKNTFHFYLRRSKGYDKLIRAVDLQRIDMGIAMCHFELTAAEMKLAGKWKIKDPRIGPLPERTEYMISWLGE
jgi:hypothetical protein